MTQITDPLWNRTLFKRDTMDWVKKITDVITGLTQFTYDTTMT